MTFIGACPFCNTKYRSNHPAEVGESLEYHLDTEHKAEALKDMITKSDMVHNIWSDNIEDYAEKFIEESKEDE